MVGGLVALVIGGVGLLATRLVEVSRPVPIEAPIPVFHLVESGKNLDLNLEGPPGRHAIVIDTSGYSRTVTLDAEGKARLTGIYTPSPPKVEPETPLPPKPSPNPTPTVPIIFNPKRLPVKTPTETVQPFSTPTPFPTPTRTTIAPPAPSTAPTPAPVATATAVPMPTTNRPSKTETPQRRPTIPPGAPPILHLVTDSGPSIAITFDGGASSNRSAELLDLLEELKIKATLFLTGQFIEKHPRLVRRAVLAGHEIGNHSFSHPHLTTWEQTKSHRTLPGITRATLTRELRRTETAYRDATGRPMAPLWRAPFGEENATLRAWALDAGYLHVRWSSLEGRSLDSLDWIEDEHSRLYRDSKRIMNILLAFPRLKGGIVLMHLASDRNEAPWTHLPEFAEELRKRGIEPCKVSTLLRQSGIWRRWLEKAESNHRKTNQ